MNDEELIREYVKSLYSQADSYRKLAAHWTRRAEEVERQAVELEKRLETPSQAQETHDTPLVSWHAHMSSKAPEEFPNPFALVCPTCHGRMDTMISNGKRHYRCKTCDVDYHPEFKES